MQQFFLFCTMLILASEAFSKELHRNQISKSVTRKFSRFAPKVSRKYSNSDRFMFDDFNPPMFLIPSPYEIPDSEPPFVFPLRRRRRGLRLRRLDGNAFFQRERNDFNSRKRFRQKYFRKRRRGSPSPFDVADSFVLNSPQCFETYRPTGPDFLTSVFGDGRDFQPSVSVKHPNQYILCVYPVFNDKSFPLKKRTFRLFKKSTLPPIEPQFLPNLSPGTKNKRSANATATAGETLTKINEQNLNHLNRATPHPQPPYVPYPNDNLDFFPPLSETQSHPKVPPLSFSHLYSSYLGDTQPSLPLPKITFKYPYVPEVYESSLRSDNNFVLNPNLKELAELKKKTEESPQASSPPDLRKLKAMLEEVEALLKDEKDEDTCEDEDEKDTKDSKDPKEKKGKKPKKEKKEKKSKDKTKPDKKKKKKKKKSKKSKAKGANADASGTLKEKIDSIAIPILSQISKELGKLSRSSTASSSCNCSSSNSTNSTEGGKGKPKTSSDRCIADGTWTSSVLGMDLTFTTMPNMMLKVKITNKKDAVINQKWSIHGLTLSKRGGPLMLAAIYPQKRKIASFIGQCKMCHDQDVIFGSWTIYSCVRRFSDLWRAVETKLDILRKQKETA